QLVSVRCYPAYLSVVADAQEIARHERSFERHMTFYDWRHYITLVERKPGALREHGLDAVLLAVQAALDSGRPSGEHVLNVLSRLKAPTTSTNLATTKLQLTEEPAADVSRYETLRANPPEDRHV
ncbi:IS21 family transposase, partial [Burkholderia vietnamiensis]|nr:IS21 family transposase [Burkholderia vietnamiensis]